MSIAAFLYEEMINK